MAIKKIALNQDTRLCSRQFDGRPPRQPNSSTEMVKSHKLNIKVQGREGTYPVLIRSLLNFIMNSTKMQGVCALH